MTNLNIDIIINIIAVIVLIYLAVVILGFSSYLRVLENRIDRLESKTRCIETVIRSRRRGPENAEK